MAETAIFDISAVSGGSAVENATPQQITISITENESAPTVTLSGTVSVTEGGSATITATTDQVTASALTIVLSKSGSATSGTDYSIANITIAALASSGSATLTSATDTDFEANEVATLTIGSISGMDNIQSSGTVTVTILNGTNFLSAGTQLIENTSTSASVAASDEFLNFNNNRSGSGLSVQNPLEVVGFDHAAGYGLFGDDISVLVVDSGIATDGSGGIDHPDLVNSGNRSLIRYGSLTAANASGSHGLQVAGIIGAVADNNGLRGGAPLSDLIFIDYSAAPSGNFVEHITDGINTVLNAGYRAAAMNNSWGYNTSEIDEEIADMASNGWSSYETLANRMLSSTSSAAVTDVTDYITALNNFQTYGVVVFSNSNCGSLSAYTSTCGNAAASDNAEITAALPELFPELGEAFIAAVNVEIDGAAGSETYTLISAPCGDAGEYCLAGDGYQLATLYYGSSDGTTILTNGIGTSFVAPQISAAVAILAEAFPNMTPEQWTDRLLASANNDIGFTHTGSVSFGNGIIHGYSLEAGHGVFDLYAALQPITSSSYSQSVYAGSNNLSGQRYSLEQSSLISSQSFGDGLKNGLAGVRNYSFDALGGGFEYDMSRTVSVVEPSIPVLNLQSQLSQIRHFSGDIPRKQNAPLAGVIADLGDSSRRLSLHFGSASAPVQAFYDFGSADVQSELTYDAPYLSEKSGGMAVSVVQALDQSRYMFGAEMIVSDDADNTYGDHTALTIGVETQWTDVVSTGLLIGQSTQDDTFLGLSGSGAYGFDDAAAKSNFVGGKIVFDTSPSSSLSLTGLMGKSDLNTSNYSLLTGANGVSSSSLAVTFEKFNLLDKDHLSISLSQPNRVESGSLGVKLTNLSNSNGDLSYNETIVSLKPSGRQLDLGLTYERTVSKNTTIKAKVVATHDKNHVANTENVYSSFIGINVGGWSIGAAVASDTSPTEARASYSTSF